MTAKKLPANAAKASKKSRLSVSSLLPRIAIYSTFITGIIASFYNFELNRLSLSLNMEASEAKKVMASINKAQQAYYAENSQFSDSIAKLGIGVKEKMGNNSYFITSSLGPVQSLHNHHQPAQFESVLAFTKSEGIGGKSYIGAVFAFKKEGSNLLTTISAICEFSSNNPISSMPIFDSQEIHCPPGSTMLR
ncbi:type IV pilin-like G/H family protein [Tychonema sp. LEGE 07199]|uniref:type IV pilin-like G/H family protein n=1 Tax=Tychonema sp. LEGE 07199 TaxID=1828668 RepID=UPI00188164CA|nr:type IV pilin-like G/H family protein [Tychonema sp. LEGE 07199]MBE9121184.1 type IV pilin-like G/H family protein [Tychonema sp. LEGE 07199]